MLLRHRSANGGFWTDLSLIILHDGSPVIRGFRRTYSHEKYFGSSLWNGLHGSPACRRARCSAKTSRWVEHPWSFVRAAPYLLDLQLCRLVASSAGPAAADAGRCITEMGRLLPGSAASCRDKRLCWFRL